MDSFKPAKSEVPLDLEHMKDVEVIGDVSYTPVKFIVAKISQVAETKSILYAENLLHGATHASTRHDELFGHFKKMFRRTSNTIEAAGGGSLYMDSRSIWLWGTSSQYGYANFKGAKEALEREYRDRNVTIIYQLKLGNSKSAVLGSIANGRLSRSLMDTLGIDTEIIDGKTALHMAVEFCNPIAIMELLDLGADTTARDNDGNTPFAMVELCANRHKPNYNGNGYNTIIELLRKKPH
jgi:hypothetical protein